MDSSNANVHMKTIVIVQIGILAAISILLSFFEVPLVAIFPSFLKLDASDLPAVIATIIINPVSGIFVLLIKNIFWILRTDSGGIGQLANFVIGSTYLIVFQFIYNKRSTFTTFIISCLVGTILMSIVAAFFNYYILIPFYSRFTPIEAIIELGNSLNPNINSLKSLCILAIIPFNILKGTLLSIIAVLIYKPIKSALKFVNKI